MPTDTTQCTDNIAELFLSKNRSRWLLARNASEDEYLKKRIVMIDKAKSREERAFEREKEELLRQQTQIKHVLLTPLRYTRFKFSK